MSKDKTNDIIEHRTERRKRKRNKILSSAAVITGGYLIGAAATEGDFLWPATLYNNLTNPESSEPSQSDVVEEDDYNLIPTNNDIKLSEDDVNELDHDFDTDGFVGAKLRVGSDLGVDIAVDADADGDFSNEIISQERHFDNGHYILDDIYDDARVIPLDGKMIFEGENGQKDHFKVYRNNIKNIGISMIHHVDADGNELPGVEFVYSTHTLDAKLDSFDNGRIDGSFREAMEEHGINEIGDKLLPYYAGIIDFAGNTLRLPTLDKDLPTLLDDIQTNLTQKEKTVNATEIYNNGFTDGESNAMYSWALAVGKNIGLTDDNSEVELGGEIYTLRTINEQLNNSKAKGDFSDTVVYLNNLINDWVAAGKEGLVDPSTFEGYVPESTFDGYVPKSDVTNATIKGANAILNSWRADLWTQHGENSSSFYLSQFGVDSESDLSAYNEKQLWNLSKDIENRIKLDYTSIGENATLQKYANFVKTYTTQLGMLGVTESDINGLNFKGLTNLESQIDTLIGLENKTKTQEELTKEYARFVWGNHEPHLSKNGWNLSALENSTISEIAGEEYKIINSIADENKTSGNQSGQKYVLDGFRNDIYEDYGPDNRNLLMYFDVTDKDQLGSYNQTAILDLVQGMEKLNDDANGDFSAEFVSKYYTIPRISQLLDNAYATGKNRLILNHTTEGVAMYNNIVNNLTKNNMTFDKLVGWNYSQNFDLNGDNIGISEFEGDGFIYALDKKNPKVIKKLTPLTAETYDLLIGASKNEK